jgi:hypothetical protein
MRGSQLIGLSLVTRQRGQWHSTCVKPSAANSSMVACNESRRLGVELGVENEGD